MKNYKITSFHEVHIDSFETGEGEHANAYDLNGEVKATNLTDAIKVYFETVLGYDLEIESGNFNEENNLFQYSVLVDAENIEVQQDETIYNLWKEGKAKLYSNSIDIQVQEVQETNILIEKLNFKKFTINDLLNISPEIMLTDTGEKNDFHKIYSGTRKEYKKALKTVLTVTDHERGEIHKGSENLYFDFMVYNEDPNEYKEYRVSIYTKDDHATLKAIIQHYIKQL